MHMRILAALFLLAPALATHTAPLTSPVSLEIESFPQELSAAYTTAQGLPSNDVLAIDVTADGKVYAGTARGLALFDGERWQTSDLVADSPIPALVAHGTTVFVANASGIYQVSDHDAKPIASHVPAMPVSLVVDVAVPLMAGEHLVLLLATTDGVFQCRKGTFVRLPLSGDPSAAPAAIKDIAVLPDHTTYAAADSGLFEISKRFEGFGGDSALRPLPWEPVLPVEGVVGWSPRDVRALTVTDAGAIAFACPQGVGIQSADGTWKLYTGANGLPYNDFTAMDVGRDRLWLGTHDGAIHFDGEHWAFRGGKRWLPENDVRDVAATDNGAWFATAGGVSHIYFESTTLAEKAKFFEEEIDLRHRRTPYEYVAGVGLKSPGDKSEWEQRDTDNDGQYTGLYGAAECFAYAATGDPKAKERATKAFEAVAFLSEVTQGGAHPAPPGFIARTILPTDGWNPNERDNAERDRKKQEGDALWKIMDPRWPTSEDGKWYWKTDASSDELDGHFLLYGLYYDLVAESDAEKARAREVTARVMDHLIAHDYKLVDYDGQPTRWANFSPASINGDPDWWAERGLNSLSVLTYLNVAWHVTGDQKYRDVFMDLAKNHYYALNGMVAPKLQAGPGSFVQFDDKMAFMNYYNLIRLEKDPEMLRMFQNSIFYYWQIVRQERNPFFNFVYAALCLGEGMQTQWGVTDLSPTGDWLQDSVSTLTRYPLDLIQWPIKNSHRIDLVPLGAHTREPGEAEGHGHRVDGFVIPIDERNALSFSEDTWRFDDTGSKGTYLKDGSPYLLAYYMGLYHGYIKE